MGVLPARLSHLVLLGDLAMRQAIYRPFLLVAVLFAAVQPLVPAQAETPAQRDQHIGLVARRPVRHVHPLGTLLHAGTSRMGQA